MQPVPPAPPPRVRRRYHGVRAFLRDLVTAARALVTIRRTTLPRGFRKRLVLVVTSVNQCRYCAWGHGRLAERRGMDPAEVAALLGGRVDDAPAPELAALLYARHWAESQGRPHSDASHALDAGYDDATVRAIHAVLHTIRFGNLTGNSWDHVLARLTGGRLGR